MTAHILMLSSSRAGDEDYLDHAKPLILAHLNQLSEVVFIPYAGVTIGWDEYTQKVQEALPELAIKGIHQFDDAKQAIQQAKAVLVGGGNTFNLLATLYKEELIELVRSKVSNGMPYIGWSAGSNICGASIKTTNDMPIIEPPSFDALGFVTCQLNPHYTDYHPPGHNGETRDDRLAEFSRLNPSTPIIAIPEGTAIKMSKGSLTYIGNKTGYVFIGSEKRPMQNQAVLNEYLA